MQWTSEKTPKGKKRVPFKVTREILLACLIKRLGKLGPWRTAELKSFGKNKRWEVTNSRSRPGMRPARAGQTWQWAGLKSSGAARVHCKSTRHCGGLFSPTLRRRTASPSHPKPLLTPCPLCYQKQRSYTLVHLQEALHSAACGDACQREVGDIHWPQVFLTKWVFTFIALNARSYFKLQCE